MHDPGVQRKPRAAEKLIGTPAYADPAAALNMEEGIRSPVRAYSTASEHVPVEETRQEVKVLSIALCSINSCTNVLGALSNMSVYHRPPALAPGSIELALRAIVGGRSPFQLRASWRLWWPLLALSGHVTCKESSSIEAMNWGCKWPPLWQSRSFFLIIACIRLSWY